MCGGCIDYCSSVTQYLPQITEGRASSGSHSESIVHHGREGMVAGVSGAAGRMASPVRKQKEVNIGTCFFFFLLSFLFFSLSGIWPMEWCYPHLGLGFLSSVKLFWRHRQTCQSVCFHGDPKTSHTHDKE